VSYKFHVFSGMVIYQGISSKAGVAKSGLTLPFVPQGGNEAGLAKSGLT
jgi:hypothetical protein